MRTDEYRKWIPLKCHPIVLNRMQGNKIITETIEVVTNIQSMTTQTTLVLRDTFAVGKLV